MQKTIQKLLLSNHEIKEIIEQHGYSNAWPLIAYRAIEIGAYNRSRTLPFKTKITNANDDKTTIEENALNIMKNFNFLETFGNDYNFLLEFLRDYNHEYEKKKQLVNILNSHKEFLISVFSKKVFDGNENYISQKALEQWLIIYKSEIDRYTKIKIEERKTQKEKDKTFLNSMQELD